MLGPRPPTPKSVAHSQAPPTNALTTPSPPHLTTLQPQLPTLSTLQCSVALQDTISSKSNAVGTCPFFEDVNHLSKSISINQ